MDENESSRASYAEVSKGASMDGLVKPTSNRRGA